MEKYKNPPISHWIISDETFFKEGQGVNAQSMPHEGLKEIKGYLPPELYPTITSTGRKLLLVDTGCNINGVVVEKSNREMEAVNITGEHKITKSSLDAMWWVESTYYKYCYKAKEEKRKTLSNFPRFQKKTYKEDKS